MLTRIRNACRAQHKTVAIPSSKIKESIASLLEQEGYILDYQVLPDNKQNVLQVRLKYLDEQYPIAMPPYAEAPEADLRALARLMLGG